MMRPATSLGPPAANGTTRVSGRVGQLCAAAGAMTGAWAASAVARSRRNLSINFGPGFQWVHEMIAPLQVRDEMSTRRRDDAWGM
jgi:hypothetical protein